MNISSLPNEVLAKVFLWGTIIWWKHDRRGLPFPVNIGRICTHWRELSQTTPELWKRIFVPFFQSHIDPVEWVAEWLEKSFACKYSIIIDATESAQMHNLFAIKQILLGQDSARLQHLEVRGWSTFRERDMDIISPLYRVKHVPNLESLSLIFVGGGSIAPKFNALHGSACILGDTPRLSRVTLAGIQPSIGLSKLSHVSLQSLQSSFDEIRDFFAASPELNTLILHHLRPSPEPTSHQRHAITVRSLRELDISFAKGTTGTPFYFFGYCQFTNLEHLAMDGESDFVSALRGSVTASEIRSVKISNGMVHDSMFSQSSSISPSCLFLHSMSNLRHIQFFNAPVSSLLMNKAAKQLQRKRSLELHKERQDRTLIRRQELPFFIFKEPPALPHKVWPKLHTVTVDTLVGGDLASICNFVSAHKNIQKVRISSSSKRHLLQSVRRMEGDYFEVPGIRTKSWESNTGVLDALEWLKSRVRVEDIGPVDSEDPFDLLPAI